MYPNMKIKTVMVENKEIQTCGEGYIVNRDEWSEGFVHAQAEAEGLELTDEHWDVVRFLRYFYEEHGAQAEVRKMVKHLLRLLNRLLKLPLVYCQAGKKPSLLLMALCLFLQVY